MASAEDSSTVADLHAGDSTETTRIECHVDLKAFFHETLTRALSTRRVEVPELTEFYLVGLLAALGHDVEAVSRSLVELSFDVSSERESERLTRLRSVGDQALSVSGLFDAQLERRGISRSYLSDLGSRAYRGAGVLASKSRDRGERERAQVFLDLGTHFRTYAGLLEDVREATVLGTPDDVVSLYERFQKTRSPALAERLLGHGVVPIQGSVGLS
jgi:hypothetical protein